MHIDIKPEAHSAGQFEAELLKRQQRVQELEAARNSGNLESFNQALYDLLEFCQFNTSFLSAYFWPAYPKSKPLIFADYPFATSLFDLHVGGFTVIRGSRQISKSTSFACRQQMVARMLPAFRSLYIAPRPDQLRTYVNRFRDMEKSNRFYQKNKDLRQNLAYKEYANGSVVEMAYVLTSAAGIRGKSTDELLFDEYQNFDPELEVEVSQTQSASEMPITIYAGTSLTTDSALEARWNESSQGSWVMKCAHCK